MFLEKVEIQGFKSFADKTTLTFNRELTAIVGPNGSGKSNTAEAVRWALGEQSLKTLRTKKSEEVIFTGSDKRSRVSLAEVHLYLNNEDGIADIDFREIVITRRLYRSGESEYLLNNNKVRLQDVQLLLAKANFGQRSYSIIGQGMIDHLVTASALERKEMFDEATGVRQYQIKKEQAEHKLVLTQENMTASQQVVNELEPRLRSLTRQIKRLEQREILQKTLTDLQINYYATLWRQLQQEQTTITKPLAVLNQQLAGQEKTLNQEQEAFTKLSHGQSQVAEFADLQQRYQILQQQKSQILKDLALAESKETTELIRQGKTDQVWLTDQLTNKEQQQLELINAEKNLNNQLRQLAPELTQAKKIQQQLTAKLTQSQNELTAWNNRLTHQTQLPEILAELTELRNSQAYFLKQIDELPLADLKKEWAKICRKLDEIIAQSAPSDRAELDLQSQKLQQQIEALLTEQDQNRQQVAELTLQQKVIEEKIQLNLKQQEQIKDELKKLASLTTGQPVNNASDLEKQLKKTEKDLDELSASLQNFNAQADQHKQELLDKQQQLTQLQKQLDELRQTFNDQQIALAKIQTRAEDLAREITENLGVDWEKLIETNKPEKIATAEMWAEIQRLKNQLALIGGLEDNVAAEHQEVKERYDFLHQQLIDLEKSSADLQVLIADLDTTIQKKFQTAFQVINEQFNNYFKVLFSGGSAKLTLAAKSSSAEATEDAGTEEDLEDTQPEKTIIRYGVEIQATPPGKRLSSINTLSGGEKALTAIALISAIIASNPSPFVILDEVDAALDEANCERFAKIIASLSDKTQFICITHNRATMHHAAILYGVTMGDDGVSKLLSLKLSEAEQISQ